SVSPPLYELLVQIRQVSEDSGGALDITLGRLCRLWSLDEPAEQISIPTPEQIQAVLADCGYGRVQLSDGAITLPTGMQLDLGAVGKGIACDRIREYLSSHTQITGAVVAVGGSVVTYGQKPDGSPWKVAIMHPREEGSYLGILSLSGEHYISTSGDYERYVMADGVRYHHILDPATGCPARSGLCSVTIVCDSGLLADALSTACFVLGPEQGLALAQAYGAEALLVEEDGSLHLTEGMEKMYDTYGGMP
ncbi:MAG: FAD:protein FMN transferase, partial [Acetatifactor sp.]|nr:FAD:protein FMN transferase [Acetatifactor sp.]